MLAQQVMMARVDQTAGENESYSMDQWPGYEINRRRILKFFAERKIANPIVLTGDIHSNWANDLLVDFDDLDGRPVGDRVRRHVDLLRRRRHRQSRAGARASWPKTRSSSFTTPSAATSAARSRRNSGKPIFKSSNTSPGPGSPIATAASFVVEAGQAGLKPV